MKNKSNTKELALAILIFLFGVVLIRWPQLVLVYTNHIFSMILHYLGITRIMLNQTSIFILGIIYVSTIILSYIVAEHVKGFLFFLLLSAVAIFGLLLTTALLSYYGMNDMFILIASLFVIVLTHECLHAIAYRHYGCSAIPIPIMIPPILGITIAKCYNDTGSIPKVAPLIITLYSFPLYFLFRNIIFLGLGILNLIGSLYDIVSLLFR